jgi:hypothetical protein
MIINIFQDYFCVCKSDVSKLILKPKFCSFSKGTIKGAVKLLWKNH